jgi:hypothetical protein
MLNHINTMSIVLNYKLRFNRDSDSCAHCQVQQTSIYTYSQIGVETIFMYKDIQALSLKDE